MWLSQQNTNAASGRLYHTQPSHRGRLHSLVSQTVMPDQEVGDNKDVWKKMAHFGGKKKKREHISDLYPPNVTFAVPQTAQIGL